MASSPVTVMAMVSDPERAVSWHVAVMVYVTAGERTLVGVPEMRPLVVEKSRPVAVLKVAASVTDVPEMAKLAPEQAVAVTSVIATPTV